MRALKQFFRQPAALSVLLLFSTAGVAHAQEQNGPQADVDNATPGPVPIRELLESFVTRNVENFAVETERMAEELSGTQCELDVDASIADLVPEPTTVELTVSHEPPPLFQLAAGEFIDPETIVVNYGSGRRIAADQDAAQLLDLPSGVPVKITADIVSTQEQVCRATTTRDGRDGLKITERKNLRFHATLSRKRQVNITSIIGDELKFEDIPGFALNSERHTLELGAPGKAILPRVTGVLPRRHPVACDVDVPINNNLKSFFVFDKPQEIPEPTYPAQRPGTEFVAVGVTGMVLVGTNNRTGTQHIAAGPGAVKTSESFTVKLNIIDDQGERLVDAPRNAALKFSMKNPAGAAFAVSGNTASVSSGERPGSVELNVRTAGGESALLQAKQKVSIHTAKLVMPAGDLLGIQSVPVEVQVDGPGTPAGLTLRGEATGPLTRFSVDSFPMQGGRAAFIIPNADGLRLVRRRGAELKVAATVQEAGTTMFRLGGDVFLRPPPVSGLRLVARPHGAGGGFGRGPIDLFRAHGAPGHDLQLEVEFLGGAFVEKYALSDMPEFGIQQSAPELLKLIPSAGRRSNVDEVAPVLDGKGTQSALRPFLRPTAAVRGGLVAEQPDQQLLGDTLEANINDLTLVVENLGANGIGIRMLVDGTTDMSAYSARFVDGAGQADISAGFQTDADLGTGFVARGLFGPGARPVRADLLDPQGNVVASLNPGSRQTVFPSVRLTVPRVYKQGQQHQLTASISGLGKMLPSELACVWRMESGFGNFSKSTTLLTGIQAGTATCENLVTMDVNPSNLGRFPTVSVFLIRANRDVLAARDAAAANEEQKN